MEDEQVFRESDVPSRYYDLAKTRSMMAGAVPEAPSVIPADVGSAALQDPTAQKAPTDIQQVSSMGEPSKATQAGDALTAAGAAGANPYLAGAGLALKAFGMVDQAKRAQSQAQIDAKNARLTAMRAASRNIFE